MGNTLNSVKSCYCKNNLDRVYTIKVDEIQGTSDNKILESKRKSINNSSIMKIDSNKSIRNNCNDDNNKEFTKSLFNTHCPEEFNINENQKLYDYFFSKIFEEINKARCNFLEFSKLLEKNADKININKDKNNYLLSDGKKLYFDFEKKDFLECANVLKKLHKEYNKNNSFPSKLEFVEEIGIPLPRNDIEKVFEDDYIEKNFIELKNKFKGKYDIKKLLYFKCTKDPEIALIIQIIKDLKRKKGKILLNDEIKFININFKGFNDNMIGVFIILAK